MDGALGDESVDSAFIADGLTLLDVWVNRTGPRIEKHLPIVVVKLESPMSADTPITKTIPRPARVRLAPARAESDARRGVVHRSQKVPRCPYPVLDVRTRLGEENDDRRRHRTSVCDTSRSIGAKSSVSRSASLSA